MKQVASKHIEYVKKSFLIFAFKRSPYSLTEIWALPFLSFSSYFLVLLQKNQQQQ